MIHSGSCHCGAVTFEVAVTGTLEAVRCNCSICTKSGYLHLITPKRDFTLLTGEDLLTVYGFNTKVAKHTFCSICGVKPFYTPRSNPDGVGVNINCLDSIPADINIAEFDGQNWEVNAHTLAHKSQ
ncbi:MAG: GFA family protein [Cellvibrionales bacterium]|nr:GFA family protein [Cellvibrionales bacterium]